MFLLGVILRLQKSCCLYSEKRMGGVGGVGWEVGGVDWRWVAGFARTDLCGVQTTLEPHVHKNLQN